MKDHSFLPQDLQCPYSHANWTNFEAIKERHEADFEFEIHLTSLLFHPQAFPAQCAANLIANKLGLEARAKFIDACFENQPSYMNAAVGDARPSEVNAIFCSIAKKAGLLDDTFTEEVFLKELHSWEDAVKPAYTEHKYALGYGVYGTPKHVIDEKLVDGTESSWGPEEWVEKLKEL